ncbi:hypothetical protein F8388_002235 [Cannabis sativa]|uniref:Reverse transcriptase zinc-binding domain-containing protein n=1 Tax=Cannabis sativa TaxID=3483 RepID=A0A7J6FUP3_CANSA|nr:hypothetical protein G4B88_009306 [Cannabis sativa]KAF4374337.1 hypothetical protein F8388_002235 [Cannabis sativa]
MIALKDQIPVVTDAEAFQRQKYTIFAWYNLFSTPSNRVKWSSEVWAGLNTPKHNVITWLAMLNRLKTHDRLIRFDVQVYASWR